MYSRGDGGLWRLCRPYWRFFHRERQKERTGLVLADRPVTRESIPMSSASLRTVASVQDSSAVRAVFIRTELLQNDVQGALQEVHDGGESYFENFQRTI